MLEKELNFRFPNDYREMLLHSDGMTLYGNDEVLSFYGTEDVSLVNYDPAYSDRLEGVIVIANDNGDSFYAIDPHNKWDKGEMALFRLDSCALRRGTSQYLGQDLREVITKMNEGVSFSALPAIDDEAWQSLTRDAKEIYALIKFDPVYNFVILDRKRLLNKDEISTLLGPEKLPGEYYSLLSAFQQITVSSNENSVLLFSPEDAILINSDLTLTNYFPHLFFFADNGKAHFFAFDIKNKWDKGINAIFAMPKRPLGKTDFVFLAGNLLDFFVAMKSDVAL
ncbi:MAG: SMI1/KNR4 family protein [Bacteroidota bacterium]|nr:SMI1/KNR4 family protein [Bacteroidota bacterium]